MAKRDAALLQLGFFGAFRGSELVNIALEDVKFEPEGVIITINRSKTDQAGEGQMCYIPYVGEICAVKALLAWLDAAQIKEGPIFRQISNTGGTLKSGIGVRHLNRIIKKRAQQSDLNDANTYSSHSLRRGFAKEAAKRGASHQAIKKQGRWKHDATVYGYVEEGRGFTNSIDWCGN